MTIDAHQVSRSIAAWGDDDEQALDRLITCLYPELLRIARHHLNRRPPGETLEPAALVSEPSPRQRLNLTRRLRHWKS